MFDSNQQITRGRIIKKILSILSLS